MYAYCSICKKNEVVNNYTIAIYHMHEGVRYPLVISVHKYIPPRGEKKDVKNTSRARISLRRLRPNGRKDK